MVARNPSKKVVRNDATGGFAHNAPKKAALAQRVDKVLNGVREDLKQAVENGERLLIMNVDIGADSKASQKVINEVKKIAPKMAFLGLSEEEPW